MSGHARCEWCAKRDEFVSFDPDLGATVCKVCSVRQHRLVASFLPWDEVHAAAPPAPPWVLEGYIAAGAMTLLAGKPKAGKSTLACAIAEAVDAGAPQFLGCNVGGGPVVYVSEEGAGTLAPKLGDSTRSTALTRDKAWPKPSWPEIVVAMIREAERIGAVLLVVDSLAFWASFREGQEKDAGAAQTTMDALTAATKAGLAVLLPHHQRKAGGEAGDSVRGSSAILGAVDALVELERVGDESPRRRLLKSLSRWPVTPGGLVVERDASTGEWSVVGQVGARSEVAAPGVRERILDALSHEEGQTEPELAELIGVDKRKVGRPLRGLVKAGEVARTGDGRKGNPYRYAKVPQKLPLSGAETRAGKLPLPYRGAASASLSPSAPGAETGSNVSDASASSNGRHADEVEVEPRNHSSDDAEREGSRHPADREENHR